MNPPHPHPHPPLHVGQRIELSPESLVAGGDALARVDGFPIFVRAIYPGDVALVEITEVKKGFARGELVEILVASADRRLMPCPIAAECGGCDWTALRLDRQLAAKRVILLESLRRIGKLDLSTLPSLALHPSPLNYRLRSRLHVSATNPPDIGFFALRSNRVVPLSSACEVVGPGVLRNWSLIEETARAAAPGSSIELFETDRGLKVAPAGEAEARAVSITAGAFRYELSTATFFQVNRHLLTSLIRLVTGSAATTRRKRRALDLYGGIGFFAQPLASLFDEVVTVESMPLAHRHAAVNAAGFRSVRAVLDDVERFLAGENEGADFTLVDPPRAGLTAGVIDGIDRLTRERICHLSCDPVTFSRDASRLVRRGWRLVSLDLLDLFPNTHHIETLASFERAP
ncbi:MAG TPA: TRAM domain-containing protein [Thermoanaerobaculia bacterium]|nr:TRAM domain-containing protein [Thermoanaerobaculia bacterium]